MKKIYFLLIIGLGLFACERDISSNVLEPYPGDQLVLRATLKPGQSLTAFLSHTLPPLRAYDTLPYVGNAQMLVFEDGSLIDTMVHLEEGLYAPTQNIEVRPLSKYHFTVSAEGYNSIESIPEMVPELFPIEKIEVIDSLFACGGCTAPYAGARILWEGESAHEVDFVFGGIFMGDTISAGSRRYSVPTLTSLNECLNGSVEEDKICRANNQWQVYARLRNYRFVNNEAVRLDTLLVHAQFISESYAKFLNTNNPPGAFEALLLPVENAFSNIIGGYGVVVGINDTTIQIQ